MKVNDAILQRGERLCLSLRELYFARGYRPYRMSKFEEYDLYAGNKDFLVSDHVITFTDTDGKLMALKPDVTLSIIKNSTDRPDETDKVFYQENVYRVTGESDAFREIMQAGVECFGNVTDDDLCEVLALSAESVCLLSPDAILAVSDLDILTQAVAALDLPADREKALYRAIAERNTGSITTLCGDGDPALLLSLLSLNGTVNEALPKLRVLLPDASAYSRFFHVLERLENTPAAQTVRIDFSLVGDINYYNGIVFKGFLRGVPDAVLSGGQYDRLMQKLGRRSSAVGFAVYTDVLDRFDPADAAATDDGFLNIALPKGRLGETVYHRFAAAGFECPELLEPSRKLIFENTEKKVRYFWAKPSDVPIYVARGAADIGVAGKDILLEYEPDVYELADLKTGVCRMAVAAPNGFTDDTSRTLKVATKFSHIAKTYYRAKGREIDIIHLNGSIEIAPILGLSDVIVDIVETGKTLKENDLSVIDTVVPISARLIANKTAFKFKHEAIQTLTDSLTEE